MGLLARSGTELEQGGGTSRRCDFVSVGFEQCPLGPSGVVLVEAGDLVEELAADLVVEPDRWQCLGRCAQTGSSLGVHLRSEDRLVEERLDGRGAGELVHEGSPARRIPENIHRALGWKKLR